MSDEKLYYVYKHTSPNNKVYIGITCKNPPEKRWVNGHGYKKGNPYFWNAIQKYGWDNFKHDILFANLSRKDACSKEQEMISLYDSTNPDKGYNMTKGGDGKLGYIMSDETKQKISESRIGRFTGEDNPNYNNHKLAGENNPFYGKRHTAETRELLSELATGRPSPNKGKTWPEEFKQKLRDANKKRSKPVLQFDLNGILVKEYNSVSEASRLTGYNRSNISACCGGHMRIYQNCIWRFKSDYIPGEKVEPTKRKKRTTKKYKAVIQYDINDVLIAEYESAIQAEVMTGVKTNYIRACCNNDQKTAGGFIWRYKNDNENERTHRGIKQGI